MDIIQEIDKAELRILNVYKETVCDGEGFRYSIYLAGCRHACLGCHNPQSWNPKNGQPLTSELLTTIINDINANSILDGITLSGGDPFFNPDGLLILLKILKATTNKNIWCYSGYTYEQIQNHVVMYKCLDYIDVLVDGKYVQSLRDLNLPFRGSSNQRIIYLKKNKK